jgi:hypothetical protein
MTIFTDRDLERMAGLRTNWRKEFLLEVVRLRQERDFAEDIDHLPSAEAVNFRSSADHSRTTPGPVPSRPAIGSFHN